MLTSKTGILKKRGTLISDVMETDKMIKTRRFFSYNHGDIYLHVTWHTEKSS